MVGFKPLSLEKEDGEVRKAFSARPLRQECLGGRGGWAQGRNFKGVCGGSGLGAIIRVWELGGEMRPKSGQTPDRVGSGGRSRTKADRPHTQAREGGNSSVLCGRARPVARTLMWQGEVLGLREVSSEVFHCPEWVSGGFAFGQIALPDWELAHRRWTLAGVSSTTSVWVPGTHLIQIGGSRGGRIRQIEESENLSVLPLRAVLRAKQRGFSFGCFGKCWASDVEFKSTRFGNLGFLLALLQVLFF